MCAVCVWRAVCCTRYGWLRAPLRVGALGRLDGAVRGLTCAQGKGGKRGCAARAGVAMVRCGAKLVGEAGGVRVSATWPACVGGRCVGRSAQQCLPPSQRPALLIATCVSAPASSSLLSSALRSSACVSLGKRRMTPSASRTRYTCLPVKKGWESQVHKLRLAGCSADHHRQGRRQGHRAGPQGNWAAHALDLLQLVSKSVRLAETMPRCMLRRAAAPAQGHGGG
jgi:hypothetical protein